MVTVALTTTACTAASSASSSHSSSSTPAASSTIGTLTTTTSTTTSTTTLPVTTTTTDPGLLPQTEVEPAFGSALRRALEGLWKGIVSDSITTALPDFFPEPAYVEMKQGLLSDPVADYTDRLIGFYRLDLAAYHEALGAAAPSTKLLAVDASAPDAAWIEPGDCENLIGYWHLPGVRFVYEQGGVVKSFAVASLISWRGVWYVVHLGPNPRPVDVGTVDEPADGAGTPGPPGGC